MAEKPLAHVTKVFGDTEPRGAYQRGRGILTDAR